MMLQLSKITMWLISALFVAWFASCSADDEQGIAADADFAREGDDNLVEATVVGGGDVVVNNGEGGHAVPADQQQADDDALDGDDDTIPADDDDDASVPDDDDDVEPADDSADDDETMDDMPNSDDPRCAILGCAPPPVCLVGCNDNCGCCGCTDGATFCAPAPDDYPPDQNVSNSTRKEQQIFLWVCTGGCYDLVKCEPGTVCSEVVDPAEGTDSYARCAAQSAGVGY